MYLGRKPDNKEARPLFKEERGLKQPILQSISKDKVTK
jgi:hypothetical protein